MRRLLLILSLCLLALSPAKADQRDPRLNALFAQLGEVRTALEAELLVMQIAELWARSGSDTVDLLMSRANHSLEVQDVEAAKKILDIIIEMKPSFAQAWFHRAELLLSMDSEQEAANDLSKVVSLEPRHFLAYVIMGRLADEAGHKAAAVSAYRKAVEINPMLENVARRANELAPADRAPPL